MNSKVYDNTDFADILWGILKTKKVTKKVIRFKVQISDLMTTALLNFFYCRLSVRIREK